MGTWAFPETSTLTTVGAFAGAAFGGGAPPGILGQEGGQEGAAAPPTGGLAERPAVGQEAEVEVR